MADESHVVVKLRWHRWGARAVLVAVLVVVSLLVGWLALAMREGARLCSLAVVITPTGSYNPCLCARRDELRARYPDWLAASLEPDGGDCPSQSTSPVD
jgi:hypothetical protein